MDQRSREFMSYWSRLHERTARLVPLIPEDRLEWRPAPGQFSFGDLLRHLAGVERHLFVEVASGGVNRYPGYAPALAAGLEQVRAYYDGLHQDARERLNGLSDPDLLRRCHTPGGADISVGKWLRAMLEHEAHHRGQLYLMLGMLGVPTPPLFGLTSEEVARRSGDAPG